MKSNLKWAAAYLSPLAICIVFWSLEARAQTVRSYPALITDCYDADTCTADLDLGLGVRMVGQKLRLANIDAWEVRGEEKKLGVIARDWLNSQIKGREVTVDLLQRAGRDAKGKYGRWIAVIRLGDRNLNQELVERGHAKESRQ